MCPLKHSAVERTAEYLEFAPKLLRFFYLFLGEQVAAESLTLETLTACPDFRGSRIGGMPLSLLECALTSATGTPDPDTVLADCVVRALRSLPRSQRAVVVLFRGLGLGLDEVSVLMDMSLADAKRTCAEGLVAVHRFLTALGQGHVQGDEAQIMNSF